MKIVQNERGCVAIFKHDISIDLFIIVNIHSLFTGSIGNSLFSTTTLVIISK